MAITMSIRLIWLRRQVAAHMPQSLCSLHFHPLPLLLLPPCKQEFLHGYMVAIPQSLLHLLDWLE